MRQLRIMLFLSMASAIILGALWLLVPVPPEAKAAVYYSPIGTPLVLMDLVIAISGAVFFLLALRHFKAELKPAYRFIAYAQLSLGIFALLYPYVEYYNLWTDPTLGMATYLPYLTSSILSYLGMRRFSKILNLRTRMTSGRLLIGVILAGWIVHAFLPHAQIFDSPEYVYDIFELVPIIPVVMYSGAAYMAYRLRQKVGREYQKAFTWLTIGLMLRLLATALILLFDLVSYDNWFFNSRAFYVMPVIVADIGLLLAAFYFNTIGVIDTGGSVRQGKRKGTATSVDIVLYAAGMASDVTKIDPYLDKLRYITSTLRPGQTLGAQDQQALQGVYLNIEKYLVSADPMRSFDRKALRERIAIHFALDPEDKNTFWSSLPSK